MKLLQRGDTLRHFYIKTGRIRRRHRRVPETQSFLPSLFLLTEFCDFQTTPMPCPGIFSCLNKYLQVG